MPDLQRARLDNPEEGTLWHARNRMPYASTVLGSAFNSIPNMIRNRSVLKGAAQGMGIDTLNNAGNAIDNYATTRRGFLPDLLHRMKPLRTAVGAGANTLYRAVTGGNHTRGGVGQAAVDEVGSRGLTHLGNVIKSTPWGGAINNGWNTFKGALGRGVDNVWDKLTGYTNARKEWSDMDKLKGEETYGGDPLAKAHEELQNSFKQGGNPGAISPDTEALLSSSQRALFNQTRDAKVQAHKDKIAQDRIANPGIVGNTATALGNMASNIAAPIMTGAQRARDTATRLGTSVQQRIADFNKRFAAPQQPQNILPQDMSMDQTGISQEDIDNIQFPSYGGTPAPQPTMPEPVQQAMDQSAFAAMGAQSPTPAPPSPLQPAESPNFGPSQNSTWSDPSALTDENLDQIDFGNMFGSSQNQTQQPQQQGQQGQQGWLGWTGSQLGRGASALGGLFGWGR